MLLASSAIAAEPEPGQGGVHELEEIVVTAERLEESLMAVPVSVSVASAQDLDRAGVDSTYDLPFLVPGLIFSTNTVIGQPYIRGVGSDLLSAGAESSVAVYVDDVYRPRAVGSVLELFDVERVEVLKGPQGTLFGRNATGGVIHVLTRRPEPEFGSQLDFLYGNFDEIRVRGAVNAPLVDDRVRVRLSGLGAWRDGYTKNLFLDDRIDDLALGAGRFQVEVRPRDDLTVLFSGDYSRQRDTRFLAQKLIAPLAGSPAVGDFGGTVPDDPRKVLFDTSPHADVEDWGVLGRVDWELSWADLVSLSAYRQSNYDEVIDLDATEIPLLENAPSEQSESFSQELRLASTTRGRFTWLAGIYYLYESARQRLELASPLLPPDGLQDVRLADLRADSVAVFGDVSYRVADSLSATVGLRYTYDRRTNDFTQRVNGQMGEAFDEEEDWHAATPRFVLEWFPYEWALLYGSISRGYKAGGFNSTVPQRSAFSPEYLWAYEVGAKASIFQERLALRFAGFYYDWNDVQLNVLDPEISVLFPVVTNAASADAKGLEIDADVTPIPALLLRLGTALLDATITDLDTIDPNDPTGDPDQSGNPLPRAPDFSLHASAEYVFDLCGWGRLTPRIDYHYQTRVFFNVFGDRTWSQPSVGTTNLFLRYDDPSERFFVAGFARNVSDELYAQNKIRVDGQIGNQALWAAPRSYGLQVGGRF